MNWQWIEVPIPNRDNEYFIWCRDNIGPVGWYISSVKLVIVFRTEEYANKFIKHFNL